MKIITFATKFIVASFSVINIIKLLLSQPCKQTHSNCKTDFSWLQFEKFCIGFGPKENVCISFNN